MRKGDRIIYRHPLSLLNGCIGVIVEPWNMGEVGVRFETDGPTFWFAPAELEYANRKRKRA